MNIPSAPFKTIQNVNLEYTNTDDNSNLDSDYIKKSNELQCSCPEHHNINDKVQHFNNIIKINK